MHTLSQCVALLAMLEANQWKRMFCLLGHVEQAVGCAYTCIMCVLGFAHLEAREKPFPTELHVMICRMKLSSPCH